MNGPRGGLKWSGECGNILMKYISGLAFVQLIVCHLEIKWDGQMIKVTDFIFVKNATKQFLAVRLQLFVPLPDYRKIQ